MIKVLTALSALSIALAMTPGQGFAQESVESFYRGKTLTMVVPFAPGGISANFGQAVADHMGKYIPGNPAIKAEFMPGGGGGTATNRVYNAMPRDGTSLLIIDQSVVTGQLLKPEGVQYDASKINFIGVAAQATNVLMVNKQKASTLDHLREREVFLGSSGVGSETDSFPRLVNGLLNTRINVVAGFPGGASEVLVAIELGEMDGSANSTSTWSQRPDLVAKLNPILVFGNGRTPDFPDTPNLLEVIEDPLDRQVVIFMSSGNAIARSVATTPDVPEDRLDALRSAFEQMLEDPGFLEVMKGLKQTLRPMTGKETQALISTALAVSPEVVERARTLIAVAN